MSFAACAEIVRKGDPERFLAAMAAPVALRPALFAVYAFNVEVSRAPWVVSEPLIGEIRLQWWADMLDEYRTGKPVRSHEVATPLAEVLTRDAADDLARLVQARRLDLSTDPLEGWDQAAGYVADTSGNLMAAAAAVTGAGGALDAVRNYGAITGMANYLIAQPRMAASGKHVLVDIDDARIAEVAAMELSRLVPMRRDLLREQIPAARAGWLAERRFRALARDPQLRLSGGPSMSEFSKRASLLWRAALRRA